MLVHSGDGTWKSAFSHLLHRARFAILGRREIYGLDLRDIEAVAYELNVSPAELVALMTSSPDSSDSLDRRLAYAGLPHEVLAATHPAELRDMRRICGQCPSKARCARDLRHKRMATPSKYCPNEPTLRSLALQAHRARSAQLLNFPAKFP
jgi:hypothetical protein